MWKVIGMLLKRRGIASYGQHAGVKVLPQSNAATPWLPQQPAPAMMPATKEMRRLVMSIATALHYVGNCCAAVEMVQRNPSETARPKCQGSPQGFENCKGVGRKKLVGKLQGL